MITCPEVAQNPSRPSTHFATISPGTASCARSEARARSRRFDSFTCGTSRKIGTVATPRPVLEREAMARPRVFSRASATSKLGPIRR
jgi:hypothetical protein